MTYRELLHKAQRLIYHNQITSGEYDEMTKPLDREIGTCKDCGHCGAYSCGYSCYKGHWNKISKESNYGGMGDFYCADFEKRGSENE